MLYKAKISDGIFHAILETDNDSQGLTYTKLYEKIERLGKISHRDFSSQLKIMLGENILTKSDPGSRGSKVYYRITENGKKQYTLGILGVGGEHDKSLSLYQLLIYYEATKRGQVLNDKQLDKFLAKVGSSRDRLKRINLANNPKPKFQAAYEDPALEMEILEFAPNSVLNKLRTQTRVYYVLMLGFSRNEFLSYLKKVKAGKQPRPFSSYPVPVPFARFMDYGDLEVDNAIELYEKIGLIRPINWAEDKGDKRYRIADKRLLNLSQALRFIETSYFDLVVAKIAFIQKPDQAIRDFLRRYLGEKRSGHLIAFASTKRQEFRKKASHEELQKIERKVADDESLIVSWKNLCVQHHEPILKDEFFQKLLLPFTV